IFLFWNLPSGLVLYWTVSNILSIVQQIYVNRKVLALKGG
ncbi:MAG: YidC/Oxa1 family membrane protein insertase, partial [Candidatus Marinimicrobia bacterium]|nr:YidC/Oxa1 family membrane protein insertase [Candidatus Neomarinimicrobiota bacterium]